MKKVIFLKTTSSQKLEEISNQFKKYNINCINTLKDLENGQSIIATLTEKSTIDIDLTNNKAKVTSYLCVENYVETSKDSTSNTKSNRPITYINEINGFLLPKTVDVNAWGWDGIFIPRGLMLTYSQLKEKGLKISPRDMNIGLFLKDYIWHVPIHWSHCNIKMTRPIDLEADYQDVMTKFFDNTLTVYFKNIVTTAVEDGLFLRAANTRKMGNYWWPSGNAGLPITPKTKDIMHERTYMMHDIFHFHIPDLIYTGSSIETHGDAKVYDWIYTAHRLMTECFTLVLGDMVYVNEFSKKGTVYETVDKRKIYPIFRAIFGLNREIDWNIITKVTKASTYYGMLGSTDLYIDLFKEYNPEHTLEEYSDFIDILKEFRNKYDAYIIQDLKWTKHNVENMRSNAELYKKWYAMIPDEIWSFLGLDTVEFFIERNEIMQHIQYHTDTYKDVKTFGLPYIEDVIDSMFDKILQRLYIKMNKNKSDSLWHNNTDKNKPKTCVKKFLRWAVGQLFFFVKFECIPFISGYSKHFVKLMYKIFKTSGLQCIEDVISEEEQLGLIRTFRNEWESLMSTCADFYVLTKEEAEQYSEVFPIYDPHYIGSYTYDEKNHTETMAHFFKELETFDFQHR